MARPPRGRRQRGLGGSLVTALRQPNPAQRQERGCDILTLRRQRLSGPVIARRLGRPASTVGLVLRRNGLGRLRALDDRPTVIRYERDRPGELLHLDIKKLGRIDGIGHRITGDRTGHSNKRGTGWEYRHVAIDDASRLAYTALLPTQRKESAVAFTPHALAWFGRHGLTIERLMSDNGSAYKSFVFRDLLAEYGITHKRTKPYTPRTNEGGTLQPARVGLHACIPNLRRTRCAAAVDH